METTIFESDVFTDPDEMRVEFADELAEYYDKPVSGLSDDEVYRYYAHYENLNWEDETSALDSFLSGSRLLVHGSIGRWDGVRYGFEISDDFSSLLHSNIFDDCSSFRIWDDNGALLYARYPSRRAGEY